ncbi:hypothetical protein [Streptomyces sp. NBC_01294]|nr:hypothetical protein [Streptomyces sp. NBC_01294]WRZ56312.1 hypothetical protein OG534_07400 [Streptomyces sp. NBC_01294]
MADRTNNSSSTSMRERLTLAAVRGAASGASRAIVTWLIELLR